jgi:16S rRNA (guanine527-N7)-methyltransferase
VKHRDIIEMDSFFAGHLAEMGVAVPTAARGCMLEYLAAVLEANTRVNLTRITRAGDAIRLHLIDSLSALPDLAQAPPGSALDIGSGGGFPGVPLSIGSGRDFTLLDSVAKKGAVVSAVLARLACLDVSIEVCAGRAEEFAVARPGHYAAIVARAVAPLPALVELAAPLLQDGGHLIALKGRPESSERASGSAAARIVGMSELSVREFTLPEGGEARTIITYAKTHSPTMKLPRRIGLAQHDPLA